MPSITIATEISTLHFSAIFTILSLKLNVRKDADVKDRGKEMAFSYFQGAIFDSRTLQPVDYLFAHIHNPLATPDLIALELVIDFRQ